MQKSIILIYALALAMPLAMNAQERTKVELTCTFETECFEDESCAETTFSGTLKGTGGALTEEHTALQVDFSTDIGDTALLGAGFGKAMSLSGGTFEARHLLTVAADGAARYTLHYAEGPMTISYMGRCES